MVENFNRNWLVGLLQGGRVLAKGRNQVVIAGAGNVAMDVRIPDLREIAHVVEVEWYTSPKTYALGYEKWTANSDDFGSDNVGLSEKGTEANVVGITVFQVQAGTTLTVEILAIGRP